MNSSDFITHWRGIPLKNLSRDECIEAMQELHQQYHNLWKMYEKELTNRGNVDFMIY